MRHPLLAALVAGALALGGCGDDAPSPGDALVTEARARAADGDVDGALAVLEELRTETQAAVETGSLDAGRADAILAAVADVEQVLNPTTTTTSTTTSTTTTTPPPDRDDGKKKDKNEDEDDDDDEEDDD